MTRDYKSEYKNYHGKPEQIAKRSSRNKARRVMLKNGSVSKGDNKDVDHKNGNPTDNSKKNLTVKSKASNRSFPRTKTARKAPNK